MTAPLQPLRIPAGWTVAYNDFREVEPSPEAFAADLLREDLLQLCLSDSNPKRIVDLGWYGPLAEGGFTVVCVERDFHGKALETFRTRDRHAAVLAVERMLELYGRAGLEHA
jgi:hypothetical protein